MNNKYKKILVIALGLLIIGLVLFSLRINYAGKVSFDTFPKVLDETAAPAVDGNGAFSFGLGDEQTFHLASAEFNQRFFGKAIVLRSEAITSNFFYHPFHPDQVVFTAVEVTDLSNDGFDLPIEAINRIYSYNIANGELVEIYQEKGRQNSPFASSAVARKLQLIGRDGSKLIVLINDLMNSPGPCYDNFVDAADRIKALDLNNIAAGLVEYQIPEERIVKGRGMIKACLEDISREES